MTTISLALPDSSLDQIFSAARTYPRFLDRPVDDVMLRRLYDLFKWGPTSMNCQPARVVFVRGAEAKERLRPALSPGNVEKTMAAPVTAIVALDSTFHEFLPTQFPANPGAAGLFASNATLARDTAVRNSALQGAYLMLEARALGLAVGPMSGFDPALVNQAFFTDGRWQVNFLVNLGWGDPSGLHPRGPRLPFEEVVRIL